MKNKITFNWLSFVIFVSGTLLLGSLLEYKLGYLSSYYQSDGNIYAMINQDKDEGNIFEPKQEYWNDIPLPHKKMIVQIIGKDIKVKDIGLSGMIAYTGSMKPSIYGGNRVLEIKYNLTGIKQEGNCPGLKAGQIISFKNEDNPDGVNTLHRIIDNNLSNGHLRTRGDNAEWTEYPSCEDIVTVAVGVLWT